MNRKRRLLVYSALAAGCAFAASGASAQDFPSKPITFVVPYGPGATLDIVARIVGQGMAKILAQPVVMENKAGADAIIGFEYVAKQVPADGYTIMIAAVSGLATLPLTVKGLRFDPLKDLPPVAGLVEGKYILAVPATLPVKNFAELVTYAKANPGKLNFGASSSTVRLQTEALLRDLSLDVVYVPYRSGPNYLQAVQSGEIQLGFVAEGSAVAMGNKARMLAVTGTQRTDNFPDAPTFIDLGLPAIRGVAYSLNVRAGTPKPVFDKIEAAALQALKQPDAKAQLLKMGLDPVAQPADAAAKRLAEEAKVFGDVAHKVGIEPV